jgi:hypothetical protein
MKSTDTLLFVDGVGLAVAGATLGAVGGDIGFATFGSDRLAVISSEREGSAPKLRLVGIGAAPLAGGLSAAAAFQF